MLLNSDLMSATFEQNTKQTHFKSYSTFIEIIFKV